VRQGLQSYHSEWYERRKAEVSGHGILMQLIHEFWD
jgi:hypothetical protein